MKLRTKTHLYSSVLFAVLLLAANATVYLVFHRLSIGRELRLTTAETVQAAAAIRDSASRAATAELLRAYAPLNGMIRLVAEKASSGGGGLLVTSPDQTPLSEQAAAYSAERHSRRIVIGGHAYAFVSVPFIGADGNVVNVQTTKSLAELEELLGILRIVLLSVSAAVIAAALVSSGLLGRLIMRPIEEMTRTMREVARSGQFVRLKPSGRSKDELTEMGETFNEMIGLLEVSFSKQEQFVSNASHELKTPLTVIESYANLLRRRGADRPDLFAESVEAIHSEAKRMRGMTEQLLLLAKPHRSRSLELRDVAIPPLVEETISDFRAAYAREVELAGAGPDGPALCACTDPDLLRQLLIILLDNARKYSDDAIRVDVEAGAGCCRIKVTDRGVGIPAAELPHVFNRFYRVDKARSKREGQEGGAGLGLSLAREIGEAIGVRVSLESVEGLGTTATLLVPERPVSDGASQ